MHLDDGWASRSPDLHRPFRANLSAFVAGDRKELFEQKLLHGHRAAPPPTLDRCRGVETGPACHGVLCEQAPASTCGELPRSLVPAAVTEAAGGSSSADRAGGAKPRHQEAG